MGERVVESLGGTRFYSSSFSLPPLASTIRREGGVDNDRSSDFLCAGFLRDGSILFSLRNPVTPIIDRFDRISKETIDITSRTRRPLAQWR